MPDSGGEPIVTFTVATNDIGRHKLMPYEAARKIREDFRAALPLTIISTSSLAGVFRAAARTAEESW